MHFVTESWANFWMVVWVSPVLWSFVLLLDVFQTNYIFQDRWDGPIISSLFFFLPAVIFYSAFPFNLPDLETILLILTAGAFGSITFFFYFSALKYNDDVVIADSINNIAIVLVPLLGYVFFGLEYNFHHILAIAIAFASALLFTFEIPHTPFGYRLKSNNDQLFWRAFYLMMISMLFLTLSIVLADRAYYSVDFASGFVLYSLGHILGGLCIWIACPKLIEHHDPKQKGQIRQGIPALIKRHWRVFTLSEIMAVTAIVFFQRAIHLGDPAVATIVESTAPFMVMLFSLFIIASKRFPRAIVDEISQKQLHNPIIKLVACVGMLCSLVTMAYFTT